MNWLRHKVRSLNAEQAKHLAETARLIATAQFAYVGYTSLNAGDIVGTLISLVFFAEMEWAAIILLRSKE